MSSLLGTTEAPKDEATKELLVLLYFYLLSTGISQLNKAGHPDISSWAKKVPIEYMLGVLITTLK